jgi:hypothetical protein
MGNDREPSETETETKRSILRKESNKKNPIKNTFTTNTTVMNSELLLDVGNDISKLMGLRHSKNYGTHVSPVK